MDLSKIHQQSYLYPEELANSNLPFDDSNNVFSFPPLAAPRNKTSLFTPLTPKLIPRLHPQNVFSNSNPYQSLNCTYPLNPHYDGRAGKSMLGHFPPLLRGLEYRNREMFSKFNARKCDLSPNIPMNYVSPLSLDLGINARCPKWRNGPSALMQPEYKHQSKAVEKSSLLKTTIAHNSTKPESQGVLKLHPGETEYKCKWRNIPSALMQPEYKNRSMAVKSSLEKTTIVRNSTKPESHGDVLNLHPVETEYGVNKWTHLAPMPSEIGTGNDQQKTDVNKRLKVPICSVEKPASYANVLKLNNDYVEGQPETGSITVGICDNKHTGEDWETRSTKSGDLDSESVILKPSYAERLKLTIHSWKLQSERDSGEADSGQKCTGSQENEQMDDATCNPNNPMTNADPVKLIPGAIGYKSSEGNHPSVSSKAAKRNKKRKTNAKKAKANAQKLAMISTNTQEPTSFHVLTLLNDSSELQTVSENSSLNSCDSDLWDDNCETHGANSGETDSEYSLGTSPSSADRSKLNISAPELQSEYENSPAGSGETNDGDHSCAAGNADTEMDDAICNPNNPTNADPVKFTLEAKEFKPTHRSSPLVSSKAKKNKRKSKSTTQAMDTTCKAVQPASSVAVLNLSNDYIEERPESANITVGSVYNKHGNQKCEKQSPISLEMDSEWCPDKALSCADELRPEYENIPTVSREIASDQECTAGKINEQKIGDSPFNPDGQTCHSQPKQNPTTEVYKPVHTYTENIESCSETELSEQDSLMQEHVSPAAKTSTDDSDPGQISAIFSDFEFDDSLRTPESPSLQEYKISQNQTPVRNNMAVLIQDTLANPTADASTDYSDLGQLSAMSSDFELDSLLRTPPDSPPLQEYNISQNQMAVLADKLANLAAETTIDYSDPWQLSAMFSVIELDDSLQHLNQAQTPESPPLREYQMSHNQTPVWNTYSALTQDQLAAPAAETFTGYSQRQLPPASSAYYFQLYNSLGHTNQAMIPEYPWQEYASQNQTPVRSTMAMLMENPPFIPWSPLVTPSKDHPVSTCWYVPHGQSLSDDCYPSSIDSLTSSSSDSRTSLSSSDSRTSLSSSDSRPPTPELYISPTDCLPSLADFYTPELRIMESEILSYFRSVRELGMPSLESQHDAGAKPTLLSPSQLISSHLDIRIPCGVEV